MAILETLPLRSRERREKRDRLIDQLGLDKVRGSRGYMLSGGERRRVEIARSLVIGVLVTDHNVSETLAVTDWAYIINEGEIFRAGTPEALARDPEVRRVYLGETFTLRV